MSGNDDPLCGLCFDWRVQGRVVKRGAGSGEVKRGQESLHNDDSFLFVCLSMHTNKSYPSGTPVAFLLFCCGVLTFYWVLFFDTVPHQSIFGFEC